MLDGAKAAQMLADKKKQEELDAIAKNPCKLCSMKGRKICGCGGGGGPGGNGSDDASSEDENDENNQLDASGGMNKVPESDDEYYTDMDLDLFSSADELESEAEDEAEEELTPEELRELLEEISGLVKIERDDESGILKVASVRPFSSSEAQRILQYISLIEAEFEAFIEELQAAGENVRGYTATRTENSLIIRIPSKNYDRFIERLDSKHLLDFSGKAAKENTADIPQQQEGHRFSPLSTKPVPKDILSEN
jgi:DNA-directed RNA polymerase subunit F